MRTSYGTSPVPYFILRGGDDGNIASLPDRGKRALAVPRLRPTRLCHWHHFTYNAELRGLANYYALACNVKQRMNKLAYIWQTSLFKTLANKHRQSVSKIATRLKTEDGYVLRIQERDKTRVIRVFRLKDLRPPALGDQHIDTPPKVFTFTLSRSELIRRLNSRRCEYCETTQGPFEVHHIRKLKDVAHRKARWQQLMAARRRKTLILCRTCHHLLHAGTLPDREYRKRQVKGEPCAVTSRKHGVRREAL